MGIGPPVKNISHHMKMVHHQPANQIGKGDNQLLGPSRLNNRIDNFIKICLLVRHIRPSRDKLLNDISKIFRQGFPHFGPGVFGCGIAADMNQTVDGDPIPVIHIFLRLCHLLQFQLRVVNQSRHSLFVRHRKCISKFILYLSADCPRSVFYHVKILVIFPVNIRNKMLRTLGKAQNRLEVNNLRSRRCNGGISFRKTF